MAGAESGVDRRVKSPVENASGASDEITGEIAVSATGATKRSAAKRGRPCSICTHPLAREIDRALINPDTSCASVAEAFPGVTARALQRHYTDHLLPRLEKATGLASEEIEPTLGIVAQLEELRGRAMALLDRAEKAGKLKDAIAAIREARGVLDSQARVTGEGSRAGVQINIVNAPGWTVVQGSILTALMPFPDARAAVVQALGQVIDD
ncbi:hypothetical protein AA0242T_1984 [Acetobacter aceti NRIC 0242]|uniref:Uncharacterized protein n=1 Tax=Acetobacter aceti NBRC 14818 TaxID=887700 RepID=A0AB33IJS6_ACEAC|nr:hypothetical protein [Acetobacter aceti]GBO81282.1 hypothetical protein AA0242T_1984 [Acetobacter aceti NRIC 0242]TCS24737.1 hypothetical protein EDC15_1423 [Acetobacter aceti NBRC 14818]BCK76496.1 hypothetical protein EMQ_2102 [Acetobacter aceti NBRC 14818]BCK77372.1 hypothetical protein EMQ_2978 [Acetobacter aceti NBRC 14818]GAN58943.1 hypothetical protein Abac_135_005 [Acetobacter aceti NBRC 14818]